MKYIYSVLCGFLQGGADILPISSTSHLALAKMFLGDGFGQAMGDGTLRWFVRLGAMLALILVFRKTVVAIVRAFIKTANQFLSGTFHLRRADKYQLMGLYVIISLIPMLGAWVIRARVQGWSENLVALGILMIVNAGFLFLATHSMQLHLQMKDMTAGQAIKLGLFAVLGTLPGISRSGAIYAAGKNMGFSSDTVKEYTFMLLLPIWVGSSVVDSGMMAAAFSLQHIALYLSAAAAAAVATMAAIALWNWMMRKNKMTVWMWYTLVLGLVMIILGVL